MENLGKINVLMAKNGFGKTNVLEAISLLTPGKGIRNATPEHMTTHLQDHAYQVGIKVMENGEGAVFGTTYALSQEGRLKRIFKKDGMPLKSQTALTEHFSIHWLTPSMDRMVAEEGGMQRNFIDRLTFALTPSHAVTRTAYDKAVRERNLILKEHGAHGHPLWLENIEDRVAHLGLSILKARHELFSVLNKNQSRSSLIFPTFQARMESDAEVLIQEEHTQEHVYEMYKKELRCRRDKDAQRAMTTFGPHRSKLVVKHEGKNINGEFCSTGEQKMLLLAMILAFVQMDFPRGMLLLLDDVVDHLDPRHRGALFEEILHVSSLKKCQIWLTGANASSFDDLQDRANFLTEHDFAPTL